MATISVNKFNDYPTAFDGTADIGDDAYEFTPTRTGFAKLNYRFISGTGTLDVQENGQTIADWASVTASQEKLIWLTHGRPITLSLTITLTPKYM